MLWSAWEDLHLSFCSCIFASMGSAVLLTCCVCFPCERPSAVVRAVCMGPGTSSARGSAATWGWGFCTGVVSPVLRSCLFCLCWERAAEGTDPTAVGGKCCHLQCNLTGTEINLLISSRSFFSPVSVLIAKQVTTFSSILPWNIMHCCCRYGYLQICYRLLYELQRFCVAAVCINANK